VGYEWKGLARDQRERDTRTALLLGAVWLVGGLVSLVVHLATGHPEKVLDHALPWVALGAVLLVIGTGLRSARRRTARREAQSSDGRSDPS
jgi:xanthine/uracil permease